MPPVVFHAAKKGGKYVNGPCLNFPTFSRASRIQIAGKNAKLECLIDCRVSAKNSPKRGARREGEIEPLLIAAELGSLHNFAKLLQKIAFPPSFRWEEGEVEKEFGKVCDVVLLTASLDPARILDRRWQSFADF